MCKAHLDLCNGPGSKCALHTYKEQSSLVKPSVHTVVQVPVEDSAATKLGLKNGLVARLKLHRF